MDSANSGSLQSSSGGDEEYDSRAADSVSAFMTGGPMSNPPSFFDPLSNYLQLHQNPNPSSLINTAPTWPRTRPGQTPDNIMMNSSSSSPFMPSFQPPPSSSCTPTLAPPPPQNQAARASKKRSRASRRAPTTVLTTDTTNFRAMVQEFTGIPAPPFNNSSFPRNRLDLFSTRSAAPPPPYLRRPFPQKAHPPHSLLSTATTTTAAASSSYQIPISQNSNFFNIPNPLLTSFQLQSNPKFPFSNTPKMGGLDEQFSLGNPHNVSDTLAGLIHNNVDNNAARWNDNPVQDGEDKGDGTYTFPRNFHGGKAPENVAARGEGMVESWICSSE